MTARGASETLNGHRGLPLCGHQNGPLSGVGSTLSDLTEVIGFTLYRY